MMFLTDVSTHWDFPIGANNKKNAGNLFTKKEKISDCILSFHMPCQAGQGIKYIQPYIVRNFSIFD